MKKLKFSLLALSVVASTALTSTAVAKVTKPPVVGSTYVLDAVLTNNPPLIADVKALPQTTSVSNVLTSGGFGVIATDGGGKLDGVQDITSDLGGGTNGSFVVAISGAITGKGKTNGDAALSMTIKGNGYANGGGFQTPATMNLSFKGTTGITPVTQNISNAMPGWNFWINKDGTTNKVERYDPWYDTKGNLESWTTYAFTVHSYDADTLYTTNVIAGGPTNVIITNFVQQSIGNVDLRGNEYSTNLGGGLTFQGNNIVKFGTPIMADLHDGFFGTNAHGLFRFFNATYGSNVSIGRWVIATQDSIETVGQTNNTVTTSNAVVLSTNVFLLVNDTSTSFRGSRSTLPPQSTVTAVHTNGLVTNVNYTSYQFIVLTPIATNTFFSTNVFYLESDYSFVDNENTNTTHNPGLTVEFHNWVYADVFTNGHTQPFSHDDYRLAIALQSSLNSGLGTSNNIVYTNTFVTYSSFVTNLTYFTNTYPTFAGPIQFVEYSDGDIFIS
jgi:hypothetical protein